jgi:hypothetical protein
MIGWISVHIATNSHQLRWAFQPREDRPTLNDMLVDVLSDDRGIDGGRVSLVSDRLLVGMLALRTVLCAVLFRDVFVDVSRNVGSNVLAAVSY